MDRMARYFTVEELKQMGHSAPKGEDEKLQEPDVHLKILGIQIFTKSYPGN